MAPDKNYREAEQNKKRNGRSILETSKLWALDLRAGKMDIEVVESAAAFGYAPACAVLGRVFNNGVLAEALTRQGKPFCVRWCVLICERIIHLWTEYMNMHWKNNQVGENLRLELQPVLAIPNRALDIAGAYSRREATLDNIVIVSSSLKTVQEAVQKNKPTDQNLKLWNYYEPAIQACRTIRHLLLVCQEPWRRKNIAPRQKNVVAFAILCFESAIEALVIRHGWDRSFAQDHLMQEIVPLIIPGLLKY